MTMTVGQKLVFVPARKGAKPFEVTVEAVGRRWAYLDRHGRVDVETFEVDGGQYSSPGQCYGTWEEYEVTTERSRVWTAFQRGMPFGRLAPEVTTEEIRAAAKLLRIDVDA